MWRMLLIPVVLTTYCIQCIYTKEIKKLNGAWSLNNNVNVSILKDAPEPKLTFYGIVADANPCADNPCKNNGKCMIKSKGFECNCLQPFSGKICEKDPCTDNPCNYHGRCEVTNKGFECVCDSDYSGKTCEKFVCTDYCKNNGSCVIITKSGRHAVICRCKRPFTGERCEIETCPENPCKNKGNCTVINNKINCSCPEPFSGKYCEVCCVNGMCTHRGKVKCHCYPGYGLLSAGVCKECNCGENINCNFKPNWKGYQKICICPLGYEEVDGVCKDCGCGDLSKSRGCSFSTDGKKKCRCADHHADNNGTCIECGCGAPHESTGCTFRADGSKECHCEDGYRDINGTCVEIIRFTTVMTTETIEITQESTAEEFTKISSSTSEAISDYTIVSSTVSGSQICTEKICGHGKCVVEGSQYSCKCDPGYKGLNCDEAEQLKGPDSMQLAYVIVPVMVVPLMLFSGYMAYRHRSKVSS